MTQERIQIHHSNVLVVEGYDDEFFFEALFKEMGLNNVQIYNIKGKNNLKDRLTALSKTSGFETVINLGIVRDADNNPKAAFQSICSAIKSAGLHVPKSPLIPAGKKPKVIVHILPDAKRSGMLEDVCLETVRADPAMICVEQYFQCLKKQKKIIPRNKISKAKVQVFLASKKEPGKRLGEAAKAGYWLWGSESLNETRNFLKKISSKK